MAPDEVISLKIANHEQGGLGSVSLADLDKPNIPAQPRFRDRTRLDAPRVGVGHFFDRGGEPLVVEIPFGKQINRRCRAGLGGFVFLVLDLVLSESLGCEG